MSNLKMLQNKNKNTTLANEKYNKKVIILMGPVDDQ